MGTDGTVFTSLSSYLEPIPKIVKSLFYIQKPQVFEYKKVDLSEFSDRYLFEMKFCAQVQQQVVYLPENARAIAK
jgi:hypothetical protein